jgi:hypothetical protein
VFVPSLTRNRFPSSRTGKPRDWLVPRTCSARPGMRALTPTNGGTRTFYDAIDAGTLHNRQAVMHGNPWLRLLRREVEALARTSHADRYANERQDRAELARVNREIRRLRTSLAAFEERRSKLGFDLGG